jgi:Undecaprenyl-phosphate glucose phosphotransferase
MMFLLKVSEQYSRGTLFSQYAAVTIAMLVVRSVGFFRLRSNVAAGLLEARRAVLIGVPAYYNHVEGWLWDAGIRVVGRFPVSFSGLAYASLDKMMQQAVDSCRQLQPDDVLVLATAGELDQIGKIVDVLSAMPVLVHIVPVGIDLLVSATISELGKVSTFQVLHPPLSPFDRAIKRAFDITAATLGLIFLAPLLVVTAIAIKMESTGPVFFRQTRHGYNNRIIRIHKFRTMTTLEEDGATFTQAKRNDVRITRVGRVIRRINVDELPQLVNVILGEMSIVGPRPHPIALNTKFERHIYPLSRRHNVKPGITGWAQVNGYRGETDTLEKMAKRIEHDLFYIEHWSFSFDMKIILMTIFSKTAYTNAC